MKTISYLKNLLLLSVQCAFLVGMVMQFSYASGEVDCEEVEVDVGIFEDQLSDDPEILEVQRQIIALIQKHVAKYGACHIVLPETLFPQGGQIIRVDDLFISPEGGEELIQLARDEEGNQKDLTEEELNSIAQTATFVVPSKKYPGQYHVWKVSSLLQTGSENISIKLKERTAGSLFHFYVQIPARLWGTGSLSIYSGFRNIFYSLRNSLSQIVGLSEDSPLYSQSKVDHMVTKAKIQYALNEASPDKYDSYTWYTENDLTLDLSLFNKDLMKEVVPILNKISKEQEEIWKRKELAFSEELREKFLKEGVSENEVSLKVANAIVLAKRTERFAAIKHNLELYNLREGLADLIINYYTSYVEYYGAKKKLAKDIADYQIQATQEVKENDPILSQMGTFSLWSPETWFFEEESYVSEQVRQKVEEYEKQNRYKYLEVALNNLYVKGLHQEAYLFEKYLEFITHKEEKLKEELGSKTRPSITLDYYYRTWFSSNYIIEDINENDPHREPYYIVKKYEKSTIDSSGLGFRVKLWLQRIASIWKNSNYFLINSNLWNGRLGLKSLFLIEEFDNDWDVDTQTGEIKAIGKGQTFISRIQNLWTYVQSENEKYDAIPEGGFLGKTFGRILNRIWYNGVVGVGGTVGLSIFQPLLTTLNTTLSVGLSATSGIWVTGMSTLMAAFDALIFDTASVMSETNPKNDNENSRWFPLISNTLRGIKGVLTSTIAGFLGVVYHPVIGGVKETLALGAAGINTLYDFLTRNLIIKNLGKIPEHDDNFIQRVRGPGLENKYFFQVGVDLAVVSLQAYLESIELALFADDAREVLKKPIVKFEIFMNELLKNFVSSHMKNKELAQEITKASSLYLKELDTKLNNRYVTTQELLKTTERYGERIRQTKENLIKTIKLSTVMAKKFYEEKIFSRMTEQEVESYWYDKGLIMGDYQGLVKKHLSVIFSPYFIVPLDSSKADFILVVEGHDLKDYLSIIETGVLPEEEETIRPIIPQDESEVEATEVLLPDYESGSSLSGNPAYLDDDASDVRDEIDNNDDE